MPLVFELPYSAEQAGERLRRLTGPLTGADANIPLLGEIERDGFRVKANTVSRHGMRLQSSYSPVGVGRIIELPVGCRVEVRIGPSAWTMMLTAAWFLALGSMAVRKLPKPLSVDTSIEAIAASRELGILVLILALGIIATGVALAFGVREADRIRTTLQETFGTVPS